MEKWNDAIAQYTAAIDLFNKIPDQEDAAAEHNVAWNYTWRATALERMQRSAQALGDIN